RIANGLLITIILSISAQAADYSTVYRKRTPGADAFVHIEPLLSASREMAGFIFSDSANKQVHIDLISGARIRTIDLDGCPVKSVHLYSPARDTLFIYTVLVRSDQGSGEVPLLASITVTADTLVTRSFSPEYYLTQGLSSVSCCDLRFSYDYKQNVDGLLVTVWMRFDNRNASLGPGSENLSTVFWYSLDLMQRLTRKKATCLTVGNLAGDSAAEFCTYDNYRYWYDFRGSENDPGQGSYRRTTVDVSDRDGNTMYSWNAHDGLTHTILIDDFFPSLPNAELLYYGEAEDLLGERTDRVSHAACYSFAGDSTTELWYCKLSGYTLDYAYSSGHVLAGMQQGQRVVFLDYLTGRLADSVALSRVMRSTSFFESGEAPSRLNLAGRCGDTIIVYQFDELAAGPARDGAAKLPRTFVLYQNHPNPFNNETVITFASDVTQHLSLKVFNILGQEIATLYNGVAYPGSFNVSWNGYDTYGRAQASGIYFARLESAIDSQIIKLIFLK
ncbi:MAG: T9SS type A sorting domain-containing protein, partial [candidate division Zixibacteria bacterium]|nr:T9SS type A sorting domain-containing protein [candidate division Zixibacteria bacterium]